MKNDLKTRIYVTSASVATTALAVYAFVATLHQPN
jgi:hypothetical protein